MLRTYKASAAPWSWQGHCCVFSGFTVSTMHAATPIMQTCTLGSMPLPNSSGAMLPDPTRSSHAREHEHPLSASRLVPAHPHNERASQGCAAQPLACSAPVGLWARAVPGSIVV